MTSAKKAPATTQQKFAAGMAILAVACSRPKASWSKEPSCLIATTDSKSRGSRQAKWRPVASSAAQTAGAWIAPGTVTAKVQVPRSLAASGLPVPIALLAERQR